MALSKATQSISRAEDARNDTKLIMTPYAKWEDLLVPIPTSIGILGELVFISSSKDFSIDKNMPSGGYQFIRYPDSFRACLMQVVNAGWQAFNEAHKNMDQIRLHSGNVGNYVKETVKVLMQKDDQIIKAMLPKYLGNIKTIAFTCTELAKTTENKFMYVIKMIQELLEASVNAQRAYGKLKEETETAIKSYNLKLEAAKENKSRTEQLLNNMNKHMEQAQNDYRKAMDSIPSGWETLGMNIVGGLANSIGIYFNGVIMKMANGETKSNETEDPNANNAVYSKSSMLVQLANMMNEFVNQGQINWDQLYDPQQDNSRPKYLQNQFRDVKDNVVKNKKCKAAKACIDICKKAIKICETLANIKPGGKGDDKQAASLIKDITDLRDMCYKFDTQSKKYTGSSAFPVVPPQLASNSGNQNVGTAAAEYARLQVEQTRAQLKETQDRVERTTENMNKTQDEMTKTLIELQSCKIDQIDFTQTLDILLKGMSALGRVQKEWVKIIGFFQMISNIIETSLKTTLHDFIDTAENTNSMVTYSAKQFMKDMLYQGAFQSSNIASLVNMIACTYVEVSSRFVLANISSLGRIMGLDPKSSNFQSERAAFSGSVREAEDGIQVLVVIKNNEFHENASARLAKIWSQLLAVLPPATENENQKVQSIVESGMRDLTPEEEDQYA